MRSLYALTGFLLSLLVAGPAAAQANLPGGVLTEEERTIIRDYFGKKVGEVLGGRKADAKAASSSDKDDDDDDRAKGKKAKKDKGHKGKGHKGKGRGNGKGRKGLPPGLAKRSELPPGLQRQLDERGTLPPGLATDDLPADLEAKLPPIKDDFKRVVVDESVVLIERGTNRVLDILDGVIRGQGKK